MGGMLFVTRDTVLHCNLVVLIRNRTIRTYVVFLNAPSWLSGLLCYHGYKTAQQAPQWEGLRRQAAAAERKD